MVKSKGRFFKTLFLQVFTIFLIFILIHPTFAWTIKIENQPPVELKTSTQGEEVFIDALTLCDQLGIKYQRDNEKYFFTFPGKEMILYDGGTFWKFDGQLNHFPMAPYRENYRFYVPFRTFINTIKDNIAGQLSINRTNRQIEYLPPISDLAGINGYQEDANYIFEFILNNEIDINIEPVDSSRIKIFFHNTKLDQVPTPQYSPDFRGNIVWHPQAGFAQLIAPEPIGEAKLEGPDNTATVKVILSPLGETENTPKSWQETSVTEAIEKDKQNWKIDTIIIDPGHGGQDPGAIGKSGTQEKKVVLDIGLKLRDILKNKLNGIRLIMTRDRDIFVPLHERTKLANNAKGKLFVSIHANSNAVAQAHGQETYFLSPARTEKAMKVALKENSVIKYEDSKHEYQDLTDENFILLSMAQAQFTKESEGFAGLVQKKMVGITGLRDRGVDQAGFYVLIGASMPSILVETGFLSNPKEEKLLASASFRQKLAESIAEAVEQFVKENGQ